MIASSVSWRTAPLGIFLCCVSANAAAAPEMSRWTIHLGVATTELADKAKVEIAGIHATGASVSTRVSVEPTIDVIWHLNENVSAAFSAGLPPETTVRGEGTLEPLGKLLRTRAGITTASLQLRRPIGIVHPYVGIGAAYLHVFRTEDIAVSNAKVATDVGPMIQAGTDLMLWRRTGLFVEVKKAWLKTNITGSVAGLPTTSRFELNPLIVTVGLRAGF